MPSYISHRSLHLRQQAYRNGVRRRRSNRNDDRMPTALFYCIVSYTILLHFTIYQEMNDRIPIRDRTLILRILVPGLEARLRDKMKECEELRSAAASSSVTPTASSQSQQSSTNKPSSYFDLDGVTCQPTTARQQTLWNFHCDGATYPATLVNLPCPVELHKTHDHVLYYKSVDIAQMLILYEDEMALLEKTPETTDSKQSSDGFPSYYPSGLTPPLRQVVDRRFRAREHDRQRPPPRQGVMQVEEELVGWMDKLHRLEHN
jgi:transcription initiation factor TFIID subunit 7